MNDALFTSWAPVVARVLIGGMFLMAGYQKLMGFEGTVGYIASVGLPFAALGAVIAIAVELLGGLSVVLGYRIKWGAAALAIFTLATTFIFHTNFADMNQILFFTKNLAIMGGLLYMVGFGAGSYSMEKRSGSSLPVSN